MQNGKFKCKYRIYASVMITVMMIYRIDGGGDDTVCIIFMLLNYTQSCHWVVRVSVIGW